MLPPIRALILLKTSLSASPYWTLSRPVGSWPASRSGETFRPTPNAQSKILALTPCAAVVITRARTFSKIRGAPAMKVGCT